MLKNIISSKHTDTHYVYKIGFLKLKFKKDRNNKILVMNNGEWKEVKKIKNVKVNFTGFNSTLKIENADFIRGLEIPVFGSNSTITIMKSRHNIDYLKLRVGSDSEIFIDEDFSCVSGYICTARESGLKITIGKDCMFSAGVYIRATDGHVITDRNTGEILNKPEDVVIGDHVWCGNSVSILKGAIVPNNTIIGKSSMVNKKFDEENCILAGAPAKVIKTDVNWDRKSYTEYLSEE